MKNTDLKAKINRKPLVSIVIPVYNADKFLSEALDSVLSQTYKNIEIICVDDFSKDSSYKILREFKRKYPSKIKILRNPKNMGVANASNKGFAVAKGEFIARFDADDVMYSDRIEKQVEFLGKYPKVIAVGGKVEIMDVSGAYMGIKNFPEKARDVDKMMFIMMPIQQGGAMFNTSKLPKNFSWYPKNQNTAEEVDLFFRLRKFGEIRNLPSKVIKYRQYASSTSLKDPKKTFSLTLKSRADAIFKYGYKPGVEAIVTNILQMLAVFLLPTQLIFPLFAIYRGFSKPTVSAGLKPAIGLEFEVE